MARETVRIEGLQGVLDMLKALPPEIVSKAGGPVKFGLKKAANVIKNEVKANVRKIISEPNRDGLPTKSTGLLEESIIASRGKRPSSGNGETFVVRVKRKAYTVSKNAKPVSTPQVARLLEYGSEKLNPPQPFIRPAFDSKKDEAVAVFVRETTKRIEAVVKKLDRQKRSVA